MKPEQAQEFSDSLQLIGRGWWRQTHWAFENKIPEALGMNQRDWVEHYYGYLKMSIGERKEAVLALSAQGASTREIADTLGVSQTTVVRDLSGEPNVSANVNPDAPTSENAEEGEPNGSSDDEIVEAELIEDDEPSTELAIPDDDDMPENVPDPRRTDHPDKISRLNILSVFAGVNDRLQIILKQQEPPSGVTVDIDIFFSIVDQLEERGWRGN